MKIDRKPRGFTSARLLRQREPYHYQRQRASIHSNFPRASQPNTNQPNAIIRPKTNTQREYWIDVERRNTERHKFKPLEIL